MNSEARTCFEDLFSFFCIKNPFLRKMIIEVKEKMKKQEKVKSWPVEAKAGLALVITSAVIVGGALILGSSFNSQHIDSNVGNIPSSSVDGNSQSEPNSEVTKIETLAKPFTVEAKCERYFYDMDDDSSIRVKAIVPVPNKESAYMKSVGVDYVYNGNVFDITASTSGVVTEKVSDSIYGNMLVIQHDSGIETIYASLGTVLVSEGDSIEQGQVIGKSGESLYTSGLGSCLHFEILKSDTYLNPEKSYTVEVAKL